LTKKRTKKQKKHTVKQIPRPSLVRANGGYYGSIQTHSTENNTTSIPHHGRNKKTILQGAETKQRNSAMLHVSEYFAKSLNVIQNDTLE